MNLDRNSSRARRAVGLAVAAAWLISGGVYAWGLFAGIGGLDVEDTCLSQRRLADVEGPQSFDYEYRTERQSYLPLLFPCNDHYDLVPAYVNPVFFTTAAAGALLLIAYIVLRPRA